MAFDDRPWIVQRHPATSGQTEKQKKFWYAGAPIALISLVVILAQLPWVEKVHHGPRPITAAELRQYDGGEPTADYVAFEASEVIETGVAVGYQKGKTLSRSLFVRVGDQWMLAHAPVEYRGGALVGFVRRLDERQCKRDREALERASAKRPPQPLVPYVLQADSDQRSEVWVFAGVMLPFFAIGMLLCWASLLARRKTETGR